MLLLSKDVAGEAVDLCPSLLRCPGRVTAMRGQTRTVKAVGARPDYCHIDPGAMCWPDEVLSFPTGNDWLPLASSRLAPGAEAGDTV